MTQTLCHIPTQTPARPTLATLRNSHPTRLPSNYSLGTSWLPGLARAPGNGTVNQTGKRYPELVEFTCCRELGRKGGDTPPDSRSSTPDAPRAGGETERGTETVPASALQASPPSSPVPDAQHPLVRYSVSAGCLCSLSLSHQMQSAKIKDSCLC